MLKCCEIYSEMEDIAEQIPDNVAAQEFCESVMVKAESIRDNAVYTERETSGMVSAMENMKEGLEKWIRR